MKEKCVRYTEGILRLLKMKHFNCLGIFQIRTSIKFKNDPVL